MSSQELASDLNICENILEVFLLPPKEIQLTVRYKYFYFITIYLYFLSVNNFSASVNSCNKAIS